jgi:hypothetical protein
MLSWFTATVEPFPSDWGRELRQEIAALCGDVPTPSFLALFSQSGTLDLQTRVLGLFRVFLLNLETKLRKNSDGEIEAINNIGDSLTAIYFKVLAPIGLDKTGDLLRRLTQVGFGVKEEMGFTFAFV